MVSARALLCCKNMCSASHFCTGGGGAVGSNVQGPVKQNASPRGTIWGSETKVEAGAGAKPRSRKPGQSAHAEATQGTFPWWYVFCVSWSCLPPTAAGTETVEKMKVAQKAPHLWLHVVAGKAAQDLSETSSASLCVKHLRVVFWLCSSFRVPLNRQLCEFAWHARKKADFGPSTRNPKKIAEKSILASPGNRKKIAQT